MQRTISKSETSSLTEKEKRRRRRRKEKRHNRQERRDCKLTQRPVDAKMYDYQQGTTTETRKRNDKRTNDLEMYPKVNKNTKRTKKKQSSKKADSQTKVGSSDDCNTTVNNHRRGQHLLELTNHTTTTLSTSVTKSMVTEEDHSHSFSCSYESYDVGGDGGGGSLKVSCKSPTRQFVGFDTAETVKNESKGKIHETKLVSYMDVGTSGNPTVRKLKSRSKKGSKQSCDKADSVARKTKRKKRKKKNTIAVENPKHKYTQQVDLNSRKTEEEEVRAENGMLVSMIDAIELDRTMKGDVNDITSHERMNEVKNVLDQKKRRKKSKKKKKKKRKDSEVNIQSVEKRTNIKKRKKDFESTSKTVEKKRKNTKEITKRKRLVNHGVDLSNQKPYIDDIESPSQRRSTFSRSLASTRSANEYKIKTATTHGTKSPSCEIHEVSDPRNSQVRRSSRFSLLAVSSVQNHNNSHNNDSSNSIFDFRSWHLSSWKEDKKRSITTMAEAETCLSTASSVSCFSTSHSNQEKHRPWYVRSSKKQQEYKDRRLDHVMEMVFFDSTITDES